MKIPREWAGTWTGLLYSMSSGQYAGLDGPVAVAENSIRATVSFDSHATIVLNQDSGR